MTLKQKALKFATAAHRSVNHKRKYTGEDYIVHPIEVASIVESVGGSEEMIAAALLHDTVEDTPTTLEDILREFGPKVRDLVENLTDVSKKEDGNRTVRKKLDLAHTATAHPDAKTIKLADLLSNTVSIVKHDPGFAWVYLREKKAMLEILKEGNKTLYDRATELLEKSLKELKK